MTPVRRRLVESACAAAAYYVSGQLGQAFALHPGNVAAVWPPSGIALALMLVLGPRIWPGVWIGAFLNSIWAFLGPANTSTLAVAVPQSALIAMGATLQALIGTWLIRKWVGPENPLERPENVFRFVATAPVSCVISASIGTLALYLFGTVTSITWSAVWQTWWLGDVTGILVFSPVILACGLGRHKRISASLIIETTTVAFLLLAMAVGIFFRPHGFSAWLLPYTVIPVMLWAAFRLGTVVTSGLILLLCIPAILGTSVGLGFFADVTPDKALLAVQVFLGTVSVVALSVASTLRSRQESAEALAESEGRFRTTFEQAAVGIAHVDSDGHFLRVNERLCDILGYSRNELLATTFQQITHPDDIKANLKQVRQLQQGEIKSFSTEKRYLRKDGSAFWANLTVGQTRDERGLPGYSIAVVEDITQRKRMEEDLKTSLEWLTLAQRSARLGLFDWNLLSGHQMWTEALYDVLGVPRDQTPNTEAWAAILHPDDRNAARARVEQAIETHTPLDHEYRIILPDGTERWIRAQGETLYDESGAPQRMAGVCIDITERRRTKEALIESEEKLRRIIENAPYPILVHAENGEVLQVNRAWCDISGYGPEELTTMGAWIERAYGEHKHTTQIDNQRLYAISDRVAEGDHAIRTKDGGTRTWEFSSAPLGVLPDGRKAVVTMAIDVTARQLAEESRFKTYFELGMVGLAEISPTGRWARANATTCRLLGYPENELRRRTWMDLTHPDDVAEAEAQFNELLQGKQDSYSVEKRYKRKNGDILHAIATMRAVRRSDGSLAYVLQSLHDITERKQAEAHIAHLNELLRTLGKIDQLIVKEGDPQRLIQNVCDSLTQTRGFFGAWILILADGAPIRGAVSGALTDIPGIEALIKQDGWIMECPCACKAMASQDIQSVHAPTRECEGCPVSAAYGEHSSMTVQLRLGSRQYGLLGVSGPPTVVDDQEEHELLKEVADETAFALQSIELNEERAKTQKELNTLLERLTLAQQASRAGFWDWDIPTGNLVWSESLSELFAAPPGARASFDTWIAALHPDDREAAMATIKNCIDTHTPLVNEYRISLPDGGVRWIRAMGDTCYDPDSKPLRMTGICVDITDRKRSEEEIRALNATLEQRVRERTAKLEKSYRELEDFSYAVSHEFRAPLARLQGFSDALMEGSDTCSNPEHQMFAERINVATRQLQLVIDKLLQLNRLAMIEPATREQVNLSDLAMEILAQQDEVDTERAAEMIIAPAIMANGDPTLLRLCLKNLLENAYKATSRTTNPRIEFNMLYDEHGDPVYYVRDNGAGFEMAFSKKLFVPFCPAHGENMFSGSGIGLATVRRIVECHGGIVWAEGSPNRGATFYFTLGRIAEQQSG